MAVIEWKLYETGHCRHPELATWKGGSLRSCEFPALVALLRHPRQGWVLFDTGYSDHFLQATATFPERLYRLVTPVSSMPCQSLVMQLRRDGIEPDDVGWVVLSHLHGDHVGGLADFPRARVACSLEAWQDLQARSRFSALRRGLLPALLAHADGSTWQWFEELPARQLEVPFDCFPNVRDLFADGSLLLVPLPGHAPGHYGALFHDARGPVFLVADASWSSAAIRDNAPPPGWVTDWLGSTPVYRQTLTRLHDLQHSAAAVRIVPSHCREWRPVGRGPWRTAY